MNAEDASSAGSTSGREGLETVESVLEGMARRDGARSPEELRDLAVRLGRVGLLLAGFYADMVRGMAEFRKVYGIPGAGEIESAPARELLAQALDPAAGERTVAEMEARIQDLKVHHAALLEGFHEATAIGSHELLATLDPRAIHDEYRDTKIQVGPLKLSSRLRPVMMQVVWEEFLRRFKRLRSLEPSDYEKFFRDGFREGYRRFLVAHSPGRGGPAAGDPQAKEQDQ